MEISTCEEYVLAELEKAKDTIFELEQKLEAATRVAARLAALLSEHDPDWKSKVFEKVVSGS